MNDSYIYNIVASEIRDTGLIDCFDDGLFMDKVIMFRGNPQGLLVDLWCHSPSAIFNSYLRQTDTAYKCFLDMFESKANDLKLYRGVGFYSEECPPNLVELVKSILWDLDEFTATTYDYATALEFSKTFSVMEGRCNVHVVLEIGASKVLDVKRYSKSFSEKEFIVLDGKVSKIVYVEYSNSEDTQMDKMNLFGGED